MKRIFIYYPDGKDEISFGARAELSESPNGRVYAFVESSEIEVIWEKLFLEEIKPKKASMLGAQGLWVSFAVMMLKDISKPFTCYRRAGGTAWMLTTRNSASDEEVRNAMVG